MSATVTAVPVTRRSLRAADGHARRRASRRPGAAVRALAVLTALGGLAAWVAGAAAVPTLGSLRDGAGLNAAVGSGRPFDVALVQDGVLRQAEGAGVSWAVPSSGALVPGHAVTFDVVVADNGPYDSTVLLAVEDRYAETATSGAGSDPVDLYRWTVVDAGTGAVLAGDPSAPLSSTVATADVGAAVGPLDLAARTLPAVADGSPWTADPAAPGDHRVLRVTVAYPDTPAAQPYNGGRSELALVFAAESS